MKSFAEAAGELLYGSPDKQLWNSEKGVRWDWGRGDTTKLIQDFDAALSALLAQYNNEIQRHFAACKEAEQNNEPAPHTSQTSVDKLYEIWNAVFPQRQIRVEDASFISSLQNDVGSVEYSATEMSDGERSVLYLSAQVLCIPENRIIIVDEPEIHLHPAIMGRLWRALEIARPDCLFIFITHDIQFASLHSSSDKVWVKSYDGKHWVWDDIPRSDLPEQLLLELLGNRKNVIFVEGDAGSYDIQLYTALYPDYYVVPCGGCSRVIVNTRAFASTAALHEIKAYGIIDRDYRSEEELLALRAKGIYCLEVAEVENLFLVDPLLRVVARHFACDDVENAVQSAEEYVIQKRFKNALGKYVCQATIYSLKTKLSGIEISGKDADSVEASFNEAIAALSPEEELKKQRARFEFALNQADYNSILSLLNEKGIAKSIGHFFGIDNKMYCSKVVSLLSGKSASELLEALRPFVPALP